MEAPIIKRIYRVIHEGADPVAVVTEVMRRAAGASWLDVLSSMSLFLTRCFMVSAPV